MSTVGNGWLSMTRRWLGQVLTRTVVITLVLALVTVAMAAVGIGFDRVWGPKEFATIGQNLFDYLVPVLLGGAASAISVTVFQQADQQFSAQIQKLREELGPVRDFNAEGFAAAVADKVSQGSIAVRPELRDLIFKAFDQRILELAEKSNEVLRLEAALRDATTGAEALSRTSAEQRAALLRADAELKGLKAEGEAKDKKIKKLEGDLESFARLMDDIADRIRAFRHNAAQ